MSHDVKLLIETERETDGRWLADITNLPGVMAYGQTQTEAVSRVAALAFRVLADRFEHGEEIPLPTLVTVDLAHA